MPYKQRVRGSNPCASTAKASNILFEAFFFYTIPYVHPFHILLPCLYKVFLAWFLNRCIQCASTSYRYIRY